MRFQFKDEVLIKPITPDEIIFHVFLAPFFQELAGVNLEGIEPGVKFRRLIVPIEQLAGIFIAEQF